jgi:hypothetical protein
MIHKWFVDNVQSRNDDCGRYPVTMDQLRALYEIISRILAAHDAGDDTVADKELPPSEGFFFGSNEIDEYYWQELLETKLKLDLLFGPAAVVVGGLSDKKPYDECDFEYSSSW